MSNVTREQIEHLRAMRSESGFIQLLQPVVHGLCDMALQALDDAPGYEMLARRDRENTEHIAALRSQVNAEAAGQHRQFERANSAEASLAQEREARVTAEAEAALLRRMLDELEGVDAHRDPSEVDYILRKYGESLQSAPPASEGDRVVSYSCLGCGKPNIRPGDIRNERHAIPMPDGDVDFCGPIVTITDPAPDTTRATTGERTLAQIGEDAREDAWLVGRGHIPGWASATERNTRATDPAPADRLLDEMVADDPDDRAESAYWRFDARQKGYGPFKGMRMSERDAFKAEYRQALSQPVPAAPSNVQALADKWISRAEDRALSISDTGREILCSVAHELRCEIGRADSAPPAPDVQQKYDELLMAVERKFPDETRHETALRYIRSRELLHSDVTAAAPTPAGEQP